MRLKDPLAAASVIFAALAGLAAPAAAQEAKAPPPATAHLLAYIEAFNSGNAETVKAFFESRFTAASLKEGPIAARLARYERSRTALKSLKVEKIAAERPFETFALVNAGNGDSLLLRARVEKEPPHKLMSLMIEMVEDPADLIVPDPKADAKEFLAAVKAYFDDAARADEFSGVILVAKDARVLFHEAYGLADRDKNIPNRRDTKFNLGSINKSFTQAAVRQLEAQGRLSLDDPIKKFLPDYPNAQAAEKVTVRHLLNMTSGIGDFFGERFAATPKEKIRTLRDYLPLFADKPLEFEPGTANRYSNGGYIVLGLIIEKASGLDYYDYVRENIFKPCGMTNTDSYPRDAEVANLARGYTRQGSAGGGRILNFATLPGRGSSAGGGYSTAEDMLKYVQALEAKKIVLPDLAGGLGIAGGAPGINSSVEWDIQSGLVVIVLTNLDPPTAVRAARRTRSWLPE